MTENIIPIPKRKDFIDLTGARFGRLFVLGYIGKSSHRASMWLCRCDCGKEKVIVGKSLRNKETASCGCLHKDQLSERLKTHGLSHTSEYRIWHGMIRRCEDEKHAAYKYYGGRGISVCKRWKSFENFYDDMGARPSNKYTIERVNNNKGYNFGNCMWATRTEQQRNKRIQSNNTSGVNGVCYDSRNKSWIASITVSGRCVNLGRHKNINDAANARKEGERVFWKHQGYKETLIEAQAMCEENEK